MGLRCTAASDELCEHASLPERIVNQIAVDDKYKEYTEWTSDLQSSQRRLCQDRSGISQGIMLDFLRRHVLRCKHLLSASSRSMLRPGHQN